MHAGELDFLKRFLGCKARWHPAPVKGESAEGENHQKIGEGEDLIFARSLCKLGSQEQEAKQDQCESCDPACHNE